MGQGRARSGELDQSGGPHKVAGNGQTPVSCGIEWRQALALAMILSLSSTAIVMQTLRERGIVDTSTSAGQQSFAVLLFQDIAVIPMKTINPRYCSLDSEGSGTPARQGAESSGNPVNHTSWAIACFGLFVETEIIVEHVLYGRHYRRKGARSGIDGRIGTS
jgi:monovalent cation:H+ antiporter-2, CPA2 family